MMATYKYVGKDNAYHDKNTGEVFVNGSTYDYEADRIAEIVKVTGDVFEEVEDAETRAALDDMTKAELQEFLDEAGVDYDSKAVKAELLELAKGV